jgi:hypothetical protein
MKILFLDDMESRHIFFLRSFANKKDKFDWAKNAKEAYELLDKNVYDIVFLDHDLAEDHYYGKSGDEDTGEDVAKYISTLPTADMPKYIIIHTLNPHGGNNMESRLKHVPSTIIRAQFASKLFNFILFQLSELSEMT